jgi:isocitrate dehydrogenase
MLNAKAEKIKIINDQIMVPAHPIIPFLAGDGIGPEVMSATQCVVNAAVRVVYAGQRQITWLEVLAGEKAFATVADWLPQATLDALKEHVISLKGPLTTPVGTGIRSLNVAIRQKLNLYACIRPIRYFPGVVSPLKNPEKTDLVIFRENTEDVYAGLEWAANSTEAQEVIAFLKGAMGTAIPVDSGIGLKPISPQGTKNLVRKAIQYALKHQRPSVTLVHKGNIMKFTEGAFNAWGYELAQTEFGEVIITEKELIEKYQGQLPSGKLLINDRIADNMFQQVLLYPERYSVLATPNLNGDYLSDACAAQVGGLGLAPGANLGDHLGVFEATHGTAPKYANKNLANPGSLLLSAAMMLEYMGWQEAAFAVTNALAKTIQQKTVTNDLARQLPDAQVLGTQEFAAAIRENFNS